MTNNSYRLVKVTVDYFYNSLRHPRPEVEAMVRQLRAVRRLDPKRYSAAKRQLPYVSCGIFNPPHRSNANFAYAEHFIIDIDNLADKGLTPDEVKTRLFADDRVALAFTSPSQDGVKVLFNFAERCMDAGVYSAFYKVFATRFASQHNLDQVVDTCTCDACRACFVSVDPDAYYNPDAVAVNLNDVINSDNPLQVMDDVGNAQTNQPDNSRQDGTGQHDPDDETMSRIKQMLSEKHPKQQPDKPAPYIPPELELAIEPLTAFIQEQGLTLVETVNIQYGKKLRLQLGLKKAEVNVFYGRHGFSVVQSPRCGTSADLNQIASDLIELFIRQNA